WCPKLDSSKEEENSAYRVLVTTGQARDDSTLEDNLRHLREKKEGQGRCVSKPARGIFGLWRDAKLLIRPFPFKKLRNVVDFDWPPTNVPHVIVPSRKFLVWRRPQVGHKGHGSPGKLMLVVATLIRRSRGILVKADSVEDRKSV